MKQVSLDKVHGPVANHNHRPRSNRLARANKTMTVLALVAATTALVTGGELLYSHVHQNFYCSEIGHDFGAVKAGVLLHHHFLMWNISPKPVTISGFSTSCGCTSATLDRVAPFQLSPGHSVGIDVNLDTTGDTGLVQQEAFLYTSNSQRPVRLGVSADVRPDR